MRINSYTGFELRPARAAKSFAEVSSYPVGAENSSAARNWAVGGSSFVEEAAIVGLEARLDGARGVVGCGCPMVQAAGRYSLMSPPHTVLRLMRRVSSIGAAGSLSSGACWSRLRCGRCEL